MRDEPYALIGHVRICGSPGWATTQGYPATEIGDTAFCAEHVFPVRRSWRLRTSPVADVAWHAAPMCVKMHKRHTLDKEALWVTGRTWKSKTPERSSSRP
jgi:hypothetical protein